MKTIPAQECVFEFSRSGGPGGQNVNKVNTRVALRWAPRQSAVLNIAEQELLLAAPLVAPYRTKSGELLLIEQGSRSQMRNRQLLLERLNDLVRRALVRPKKRKPTKATVGARTRRLESKKKHSNTKRQRRSIQGDF